MEQKAMLFARIKELKERIKNAAPNHYLRKHLKAKYGKEIDELSNQLVKMELNRVRDEMNREVVGPTTEPLNSAEKLRIGI